mgnify:CR=1 FL=1
MEGYPGMTVQAINALTFYQLRMLMADEREMAAVATDGRAAGWTAEELKRWRAAQGFGGQAAKLRRMQQDLMRKQSNLGS